MSALKRLKLGVVAVGLSCWMLGNAWAQQETETDIEREGQATQSLDAAQQPGARLIDPSGQQAQPHTAQFRGTQPMAGSEKEQVQHFLAACLLAKNEAEVEIGQIAERQAQNPQVKQFAQKMVQDHRQVVQKLQPLAGMQGARPAGSSQSLGTTSQIDAQRQASDTTRLPGSSGAGQPAHDANQSLTDDRATSGQKNAAVQQLTQIERQVTQRFKDAVREELQQKQGAEFDKCYISGQIAGHMHMLAALEVLEQQGPDQLRQIAQQAQPKVQQHLEEAKQLMKQLEGSPSRSQAERQSTRSQR